MSSESTSSAPWKILLYYKYVDIPNPKEFTNEHLKLCKRLGLKGRILIADEGINGTVGGTEEITNEYMRIMHEHPLFQGMEFKISNGDHNSFQKMFVRYRSELVTLNFPERIDPNKNGGTYLEPAELKAMYDRNEDFVILDMRNEYEAKIGRFKNAVVMNMRVFKELPQLIKGLESLKNKKVVTYCTGGIRCEKASALLKHEGFQDVYQLHGGVAKYGEEFPDDYWEGKLYVFDERIAVPINSPGKEKVIAQCYHCGKPEDSYINCTNAECNEQFICCKNCREIWNDGCTEECKANPRKQAARR